MSNDFSRHTTIIEERFDDKNPSNVLIETKMMPKKVLQDYCGKCRLAVPYGNVSVGTTKALRIDGFVRPLLVPQVEELISRTGKINGFWMDRLKTFCYVVLSTIAEAIKTFEAVSHRGLSPKFVEEPDAQDIIDGKITVYPAISERMQIEAEPNETTCHMEDRRNTNLVTPVHSFGEKGLAVGPSFWEAPHGKTELINVPNLGKIFNKTNTSPCIYWLPVSEEKVSNKQTTYTQQDNERKKLLNTIDIERSRSKKKNMC